jgi:hypothetical protein
MSPPHDGQSKSNGNIYICYSINYAGKIYMRQYMLITRMYKIIVYSVIGNGCWLSDNELWFTIGLV